MILRLSCGAIAQAMAGAASSWAAEGHIGGVRRLCQGGIEAAPGPRFASTVQPQQTGLLAQADLTQF
ncbi:MAG TPA: hypothetical protein DCF61_01390 [Alphaproteobacteria bacterium]|nr:hypothetical protein [Alphaproteobacteria bacterium]